MAALIYRNLKLYFRNRMGAMMSLLGALITFFIYISFLKENLVQEWQKVANANQVLDAWMMGGILTIAGVTTAFGALGQLVSDREDNRYQDFRMTALKQWQLAISYFISAFLISLIMQLVSFIIMAVYFKVTDNLTIKWADGGKLLLVSLLGTLVATVFCQIIIEFIHSHVVFNRTSALESGSQLLLTCRWAHYQRLAATWSRPFQVLILPAAFVSFWLETEFRQ